MCSIRMFVRTCQWSGGIINLGKTKCLLKHLPGPLSMSLLLCCGKLRVVGNADGKASYGRGMQEKPRSC